MTLTDDFGQGRRKIIRRPQVPSNVLPVSQRSKEDQKMLSKPIYVDHDVSIQRMLRLDDTDNILINRVDLLRKYHDMLLMRLAGSERHDILIHARPKMLNASVEAYQPYVQQGMKIILWQEDFSIRMTNHNQLTVVRIAQTPLLSREGFLLIKAPSSSRMLASWQDKNNRTVGVLVTNPHTVELVSDHLESIIQSAAR